MLALVALPAGASASGTGGTSAPASEPPPPGSGAPSAESEPSAGTAVTAPRTAFVRQRVRIRGTARKARRKIVRIDAKRSGGTWVTVARVRANRKGRFRATWRPRRAGAYELRARTGARARSHSTGGTSVPLQVGTEASGGAFYLTVYEPAVATWYGPGFFGRRTACGEILTEETIGVAHRTLPCGTEVQIAYKDNTIVVPVIDRGPYANNADWDLTQAAAQQLGMTGTSRIGAMRVSPGR